MDRNTISFGSRVKDRISNREGIVTGELRLIDGREMWLIQVTSWSEQREVFINKKFTEKIGEGIEGQLTTTI